jgi:hypothetical protein
VLASVVIPSGSSVTVSSVTAADLLFLIHVRDDRESIQLSGAYMTKANKLKKRKETRATARAK